MDRLLSEITSTGGLTLAQVARRQPPSRQDRPVNPSTVWRWAAKGVRTPDGRLVKLEALRVGGRWLTSEAALCRFILAQQPPTEGEPAPQPPTPRQRRRAAERAEAKLEELGI